MVRGVFRSFVHDHYFESVAQATRVVDVIEFQAPAGLLGRLVERAVLHAYLTRFLRTRAAALKLLAETDRWHCYVKAR